MSAVRDVKVGDTGTGPIRSDQEGRRWEPIQVVITEIQGPVLTVRWRTSWNRKWKENYLLALKDFIPDFTE